MATLKEFKEIFAKFLKNIDRVDLRVLLKDHLGETNYLDFKETWPEKEKLAKHILGLANSGGGIIVIGVKEQEDGSFIPIGLDKIRDKSEIIKSMKSYLPQDLEYEILDFFYQDSEWDILKGKKFQVLIVKDLPERIPFLSLKDGKEIKKNVIYYRDGTNTEPATYEQIQKIINRRIDTSYSTTKEMELRSHLNQLKELYDAIPKYCTKFPWSIHSFEIILDITKERNPKYPEEDFEDFIIKMITLKKEIIRKLITGR